MMAAVERVAKYLAELKKMRGMHQEEIAGLHCGDDDREAFLLASDLASLVEQAGRATELEHALIRMVHWFGSYPEFVPAVRFHQQVGNALAEAKRLTAPRHEPASQLDAPAPPEVAVEQKPVARLQSFESDRPYSEGQQFFEVIVLDRDRCTDGMELFAAFPAAPVAAGLPASDERSLSLEMKEEALRAAMRKAFNFGQTYWRQADSDHVSQHKKADITRDKFIQLTEDTCAILEDAAAPVLPVEQPSQPAVRTADCTLCGFCAATGERIAASPIAEQAPSPDLKWLAAIQALCVTIDQECTRKQGLLSEWDQGWFLGQLHVFDLYTATPKDAIEQAREYMRKVFIEADKGRALQSGQPQDQSGCDSALRAEPAGQHNATASDAADFLDKKADDYANEYGAVDPDTGTLEFKNIHGEEYYNCLRELADDIRALPATAAPVPHMGGNTKPESSPIAEPDTATQAPSESIDNEAFAHLLHEYRKCPDFNQAITLRAELVSFINSWHQRAENKP